MAEEDEKERQEAADELSQHKRVRKELVPLLLRVPKLSLGEWGSERLPEILWAALLATNLDREDALRLFRWVGKFVENSPDCFDIQHSGISGFPEDKRGEFLRLVCHWSEAAHSVLRPLRLLPKLPFFELWKAELDEPKGSEDWRVLGRAVAACFWHQSQEATDCRWLKVLCLGLAGKLHVTSQAADLSREILGYPEYGDMQKVRPSIRALEGAIASATSDSVNPSEWPREFWALCLKNTACIPEETADTRARRLRQARDTQPVPSIEQVLQEFRRVWGALGTHFEDTCEASAVASRHEAAFGLAFYGLALFIEVAFHSTQQAISGRLALRALAEVAITFRYLLKKEQTEPEVWDVFRAYGTGQLKLAMLKLKELGQPSEFVDLETLESLVNEDRSRDFVSMNIGHWDNIGLRSMSIDAGLKDLYDRYYGYTSGFMHGHWGAMREAVFQTCRNPLHRYHRIPSFSLPLLPSVLDDAKDLANQILEYLSEAYPTFGIRLTLEAPDSNSEAQDK